MFETADIAKFAPEDKTKYDYDMTTERDIRNQIRYAEKQTRIETAKMMLADKEPMEKIVKYSGLTEEQIKALQAQANA